jgi:Sec-independent protein translocase protein TatA
MGRFVAEARRAIDDFKDEITAAGEDDDDDEGVNDKKERDL